MFTSEISFLLGHFFLEWSKFWTFWSFITCLVLGLLSFPGSVLLIWDNPNLIYNKWLFLVCWLTWENSWQSCSFFSLDFLCWWQQWTHLSLNYYQRWEYILKCTMYVNTFLLLGWRYWCFGPTCSLCNISYSHRNNR